MNMGIGTREWGIARNDDRRTACGSVYHADMNRDPGPPASSIGAPLRLPIDSPHPRLALQAGFAVRYGILPPQSESRFAGVTA